MLVYFGLVAILILRSEVQNINEIIKTKNDAYTDLQNNVIDIDRYCASRACVLKCCSYNHDLNMAGLCDFNNYNEESNHIKVEEWSDVEEETNREIYGDYAFFHHGYNNRNLRGFQLREFKILQNGFLQFKKNNTTPQWSGVSPLDFCINTRLSTAMDEQDEITVIVKHGKTDSKNADNEILLYVAVAMVVSLVLMAFIAYRMSPVLKRILGLVMTAFILSLASAYLIMAVEILALRGGVFNSIECRIISPILYFFILSSFFWVNVLCYDTWSIIRNFIKYSTNIDKEFNPAKFLQFAMYGWLIPLLITVAVEVVDILKLDLILPITKPPFESCLANDDQMMVYTHIPISILIATNCILFLMNLYNIWMLQRIYHKVIDLSRIMVTKRRFFHLKIFAIICVSISLESIPDMPNVLYYTVHAYNILVGGALCTLYIYEKFTYNEFPTRRDVSEKFVGIYRKLSRNTTKRSIVNTIFMSERDKDNLEEMLYPENTGTDTERSRY